MEQAQRKKAHLERILLVAGMPNAGKSTLLRRMFLDPRFGTRGAIPNSARLRLIALSRERCLLVRCTSPHEMNESLADFLAKIDRAMASAWRIFWRFNFACAIQPHAARNMPDLRAVCTAIENQFWPERIRVAQIHPRQDNQPGNLLSTADVDALRSINVEVITIDGRRPANAYSDRNGFVLADYFDFT